jgi:hypothetical protein
MAKRYAYPVQKRDTGYLVSAYKPFSSLPNDAPRARHALAGSFSGRLDFPESPVLTEGGEER